MSDTDKVYICLNCLEKSVKINGFIPSKIDSQLKQPDGYGCNCHPTAFRPIEKLQ